MDSIWEYAKKEISKCKRRLSDLEQYLRQNSLLIHGLPDIPSNTYGCEFSEYALKKIKTLMPTIANKISIQDIDVSHPLKTKNKKKPVIIVKFVRRDIKNLIYFNKKLLKNAPGKISVTEHLTDDTRWLLEEARTMVGFGNVWTSHCVVYAAYQTKKYRIRSIEDLDDLYYAVNKNKKV